MMFEMEEYKKEVIVYLNTLVATNFLLSCMEHLESLPIFRQSLKMLAKRFRDELVKCTTSDIEKIWGIDDEAYYNIMDHQEELLKEISLMRPEECGVITEIIKRYQTSPAAFQAWLGVKLLKSNNSEMSAKTAAGKSSVDDVAKSSQTNANALVGSSSIFKLDNVVVKKPKYTIGVDTYDKNANAYCLGRMVDEKMEIILAKTIRDKKEFDKEVENLSKYFGAAILKEVD